jgi:pyruvate/2-oxoglutarate dehydrogenase complex dihydrolipoamide acyltransferase (E2) component
MAFLDKLGGIAKNLGDKAGDAVETGKLNSKIKAEKTAAAELLRQLGEYHYAQYQAGAPGDAAVAELLAGIDAHNEATAQAQAEIARIEAENRAAKEAASAPSANPAPAPAGLFCAACGAGNIPGTKFCAQCGTKLA